MARIQLARPSLVTINGNILTEHNRQPPTVTTTQIESSQRMADGTMRKYFIATKRTFSFSWTNVPGVASKTIDGYWGANDVQNFYLTNAGTPITLVLKYANTPNQTLTVMFSSFENDVQHRGADDFYNMTIGFDEV